MAVAFNHCQAAAFKGDDKTHAMLDALNASISTVEIRLIRQKWSLKRTLTVEEKPAPDFSNSITCAISACHRILSANAG